MGVGLADKAVAGFTVNRAEISALVQKNPILATALTPLVGYDKAAEIAIQAYAEGRPVLDVAEEFKIRPRAELEQILDPNYLTLPGIKEGQSGS